MSDTRSPTTNNQQQIVATLSPSNNQNEEMKKFQKQRSSTCPSCRTRVPYTQNTSQINACFGKSERIRASQSRILLYGSSSSFVPIRTKGLIPTERTLNVPVVIRSTVPPFSRSSLTQRAQHVIGCSSSWLENIWRALHDGCWRGANVCFLLVVYVVVKLSLCQ